MIHYLPCAKPIPLTAKVLSAHACSGKEARCNYFIPRVMILKLKIHLEATFRFLPNYTIMITYYHSLLFIGFLATGVTIVTVIMLFSF